MENEIFRAGNYTAKVVRCNTAIVGSGAAGFNAADRLWQLGQHDPDSVREMADTLFAGRCVDGDIALCEAALSTQCFLKLVELGVPFPHNRYGEYIGYKTDHDPRRRATSVGPYTSKQMTECLEAAVQAKRPALPEHGCAGRRRPLYADSMQKRYLGHRRPSWYVRRQRLPVQPVWGHRPCAGSRRKGQKPDRMAVRPGIGRAAVECVGNVYAGAAAGILHGGGRR